MALQTFSQMQQSTAVLPGTWKLGKGRAITLTPTETGVLRVAHGCVWATFEGPHQGPLNDQGDHVVESGGQLRLRAGQRVVIEAWSAQNPAYFSWDPVAAPVASPSRRFAAVVVQPLADLRLALGLGVGALGRLAAGLGGLVLDTVAGRDRSALSECAFNAQSRACRAHGAMS
jgi:hypothetical protein